MMKLYSYSNESLTVVEAKWFTSKYIIGGIFIGIIIFFGVIKLNQSVGFALGSRSANTLAAENNFLRQQVSMISPRVNALEMKAAQLNGRAVKLQSLLEGSIFVVDTDSSFGNTVRILKPHSLKTMTINFHP